MRRQLFSGRLEPQGSALGGPERGRHPDAHRSEVLVSPPEESQKQKALTKAEMQKVLKEKAQLTADLHSMEKSFSDLFKRFEKQKEVIEGYRTVGAGPAWGRGRGGGPVGGGAEHSPGTEPGKRERQARRWGQPQPCLCLHPGLLTCHLQLDTGAREASVWACVETTGLCWSLHCSPPPDGRAPGCQSPGLREQDRLFRGPGA